MAGSTSLRRRSSRFTRSTSGIFCTAKRTGKPSSTESFRFLPVSQTLASNPTRFLTVHDSEGRDLSAGRQRPARRFGPGLSACSHAAGRAPDDGDRRGQQDHRSNGHEREIVQEVGLRAHRPNTRTHARAHTNTRTHARTHTNTRTHARTQTHARTHAHTHTHTQTNKQTHAHSGMHGLGQFSMSRERGLSRRLGWSQHRQLILTSTFARPRQPHDLLPADLGVAVHRRADPDPARDPAPRRPGRIRARRQVRRHRRANERGAVY